MHAASPIYTLVMLTFDDVVRIASDLPGIEVGTSYGTPALRVGKKLLCRMWEDGETMVLKPLEDIELQFLMGTQPDVFYQAPHYEGWPTILIHLSRIDEEQLRELIGQCWERLATKKLLAARRTRAFGL
jgi:hypothetical protein